MRRILFLSLALAFAGAAHADLETLQNVAKAQAILGKVSRVVEKYQEVQGMIDQGEIELEVAEPMPADSGKYMLPFDDTGSLTPWAEKALTAQAGAAVGAQAGKQVAGALAAKVPFGGFMAGAAKNKAKETGAVVAIGGWDFIKSSTAMSFDDLDDYSVFLHQKFSGTAEYEQALAAAMAVYPQLEKSHERSIDSAYKQARKEARRKR